MKQTIKTWIMVWSVVLGAQSLLAGADSFVWGGDGDDVAFFDDVSAQIEQQVARKNATDIQGFYRELFYAPLWVKSKGLSPFGRALLRLIRDDETVTRSVAVYQESIDLHKRIQKLVDKGGGTLADKVALELALSKLYLHYARYRIYGGIDWKAFEQKLSRLTQAYKTKVGWEKYAPPSTPVSVLNDALDDGDLERAFRRADPQRFGYAKLRDALIRYIRIAKEGGWPKLPKFSTIKPGKSHAKVIPLIRQRLAIVGELSECTEPMDSPKYDACLRKAITRFQLQHGLKGGGVIGKQTRAALNETVTQTIQKLRLNLDRIKWLNRQESAMRIELNIPAFRLNFFNGDKLVTTIRVVVGKVNHPTPSFHNVMKYIVVNPWWKIPASIVRHEMLDTLVRDPYHYEAQGKVLHASWDETSERIDPGTVDWAQYVGNNKPIPYYFMQVPSRHNALGKIKFLFPNKYSVYIHDTPSKSLFFRNQRAFSHGCMRIQKPRELLESLALFNDNIDVEAVMKRLEGTEKQTIVLKHKVPIDITYLTAFIDPYGYLNFRKDVYHFDRYQLKHYSTKSVALSDGKRHERAALSKPKPTPKSQAKSSTPSTPNSEQNTTLQDEKKPFPKKTSKPQAKPAIPEPESAKPAPKPQAKSSTSSTPNPEQNTTPQDEKKSLPKKTPASKPVSMPEPASVLKTETHPKYTSKQSQSKTPTPKRSTPETTKLNTIEDAMIIETETEASAVKERVDDDGYQVIELYDN
jgi:murein L,D-transpeptidase YcbB/YkuD